jgi:hypothetical protein
MYPTVLSLDLSEASEPSPLSGAAQEQTKKEKESQTNGHSEKTFAEDWQNIVVATIGKRQK